MVLYCEGPLCRLSKKEQGAKSDEKGAVKIVKKEQVPKNGREQREQDKILKGAGSIDPPNRASVGELPNKESQFVGQVSYQLHSYIVLHGEALLTWLKERIPCR